ncbi:DEKNAAC105241 [Brettanomyces naardenensis]|uniref:DEKNAAC105241 n=1 Tax=Brettanomyces naardenensis TaxID=13370 RepID=A0A448YSZ7_BRENA|nr:DEKNAAC105241 [Brettanomyces naardenensis]
MLSFRRTFFKSALQLAKINTSNKARKIVARSIIEGINDNTLPDQAYLHKLQSRNLALEASQYFKQLESQPDSLIITDEYKQLPDDSQFIEEHYDDLLYYRDKLVGKDGSYASLGTASNLFMKLSEYNPELGGGLLIDKIQFEKFVGDLVTTLRLNGGHLFTLDLLIQNQREFERMQKKK